MLTLTIFYAEDECARSQLQLLSVALELAKVPLDHVRVLTLPVIISRIGKSLVKLKMAVYVVNQLLPPQLVVLLLGRY